MNGINNQTLNTNVIKRLILTVMLKKEITHPRAVIDVLTDVWDGSVMNMRVELSDIIIGVVTDSGVNINGLAAVMTTSEFALSAPLKDPEFDFWTMTVLD